MMKFFDNLNSENIELFAFHNYRNPNCANFEEFKEDYHRFKYLKKLVNRHLESGDLQSRLLINHLIVIFNVFEPDAVRKMLVFKMSDLQLTVIKPFLHALGHIVPGYLSHLVSNPEASESARKI